MLPFQVLKTEFGIKKFRAEYLKNKEKPVIVLYLYCKSFHDIKKSI